MSKRKFGFEGFGINRQQTYNFDKSQPPQRLYVPPSSRAGGSHDNYEDTDLDNIEYADHESVDEGKITNETSNTAGDDDIDPLDAFMEGIHEEMKAEPKAKAKVLEKYRDDEEDDDPMESYLKAKKDVGLALASEVMNAGYNSDEEVYAAAKAVDNGMLEYDEDDNPIMVDKKRIEPIAPLDHSCVDYEAFNKDFYEEKPSVSGIYKS